MGDTAPEEDWPGQHGFDPVRCPHCDEVTTPNLLADGSYVCSCTAERALPLSAAHGTPWDGEPVTMPAPMDDASFVSSGARGRATPPGEGGAAAEGEEKRAKRPALAGAEGQFGRDISTEGYEPLNDAPAATEQRDP
jgi:hypothetical protein